MLIKLPFVGSRVSRTRRAPASRRSYYAGDRYAKQRRTGFPWLLFWPDLEREYRQHSVARNTLRIRLANGICLLGVLGLVVLDPLLGLNLLDPHIRGLLAGVTTPALLVPVIATYFPHSLRRLQTYVLCATFVIGWSIAYAIYLGGQGNPYFPGAAVILITMYVFFLSGLLYYQAVFCSAVIAIGYVAMRPMLNDQGAGLHYETQLLLLGNVMGWMGLYVLERDDRNGFLLQNELKQQALLDSLTGLLNRRAFRAHLDNVWLQAQRENTSLGLMLLDLDHFKQINDCCGHVFGDTVLQHVAQVLKSCALRPLDAVGRYGGDEFIGVWYDMDPQWFSELAQSLPTLVAGPTCGKDAAAIPVTLSGGAVVAWPQPEMRIQDLIKLADDKLYEIKRGGRHTVAVTTFGTMPARWRPGVISELNKGSSGKSAARGR